MPSHMAGNANASYKAFVSVRVTSVPEATVVHCCGGTTARVAYNAVFLEPGAVFYHSPYNYFTRKLVFNLKAITV